MALAVTDLNAQQSPFSRGLYVRIGAAYSPFVATPHLSYLIDPLLSLPAHNASVSYEMQWQTKRGLGFVFQLNYVNSNEDARATFTQIIQQQFPGYYVDAHFAGLLPTEPNGTALEQGLIGCSYNFTIGEWALQPRIMIGGSTFYPLPVQVSLKQQDSNQLITLTLTPENQPEESYVSAFTVAAGGLIQRHIWKRLSVFGNVEWASFNPGLLYHYRLVNEATGKEEVLHTYGSGDRKLAHMLHLGAGVTFRITR